MALTIKLDADIQSIVNDLEKVGDTAKKVYGAIASEAKKAMKVFDMQTKSLVMASAATMGMFWGLAQVSPLVSAMLGNLSAALGAIFNVIFASLLPAFQPLLAVLFKFAAWLQEQPAWLSQFLGILILIPPTIIAIAAAVKVWNATAVIRRLLTIENIIYMKQAIAAKLIDIKVTIAAAFAMKKAAVATKLLNFALAATPWGLVAIAVGAIGFGIASWASSSKSLQPSLESTVEQSELWNAELWDLKQNIADVKATLGDFSAANDLLVKDMIASEAAFMSSVQTMIAGAPELSQAALASIHTMIYGTGGIEENMKAVQAIQMQAFGRELSEEELATINGYANATDAAMQSVIDILSGSGASVTAAFNEVISGHMTLNNSFDNVTGHVSATTDELVGLEKQYTEMTARMLPFLGAAVTGVGEMPAGQTFPGGAGDYQVNPFATPGRAGAEAGGFIINLDVHDNTVAGEGGAEDLGTIFSEMLSREIGRYI